MIRLLAGHPLTSPELTGDWENRLAKIESGTDSRKAFMGDIVKFAESTVGELDTKLKDVRIPRAKLGPCPVCGREINENRKGYSCWGRDDPGCGFVIWKGKAGKQLPVAVARELIKTSRTEKPVTGFKSRAGKSFRARLALMQTEDGKWRTEFDEPWAREGAKPPEAEEGAAAAPRPPRTLLPLQRRRPPSLGPPRFVLGSRHHGAMALTLVLGPANSAKAGRVLGAYAGQAASRRTAGRADRGRRAPLRSRADRRRRRARRRTHVRRAGRGDRAARRLRRTATDRAAARARAGPRAGRAELPSLRESATAPGFRAAAGAMISELQRELVGVARFRAALRAWAAQDVRRAAYGRDLGRIYADYAAELERLSRVDAELFAWRAVDALRAAPTAWGSDPVLFYGFDDLDGVQRDVVQTLAGPAGAAVTVSLTYEAGREALAARAETVEALRPLAAEVETLGAAGRPLRRRRTDGAAPPRAPPVRGRGATPESRPARSGRVPGGDAA